MSNVHRCRLCQSMIRGTVADPVISAPSLGKGFYHDQCAQRIWSQQRHGGSVDETPPQTDAIDEVADMALALLARGI